MRIILLYFIIVFIVSCTSTTTHENRYFVINNSGRNLRLDYFKNGFLVTDRNLSMINNENKLVYSQEGEGSGFEGTYSNYILTDSVQVVFSDGKKTTHYYTNINGNNLNALNYSSGRNLYNIENNWEKKILLENKRRTERDFVYTITTEDYLKAK